MSWSLNNAIAKNKLPSAVPNQLLLVYIPAGPDPQFRPLSVGEYYRMQGYSIKDFQIGGDLPVSKFLNADQAVSLPGRSFHLKSFSAFMLAVLAIRRLKARTSHSSD